MNNLIWLSGSRGFVGTYVTRSLLDSDDNVICVSNSPSKNGNVIHVDYSKRDQVRKALEMHGVPDTFIHLGWGNVYEPHHECHINENVQDGINMVDELYKAGAQRIILIGSSSEYGDRTGPLQEQYPPTGDINNYIKGKRALAEYGLEAAKVLDRIFVHVRLFYTYGAGQKHNSLINQLFQAYQQGADMKLSPCEQYRDYIYVSEAAEGISRIAQVEQSGIVNLGSGKAIKLKDFVKLFWDELGADPDRLIFGSHDMPESEQSQPKSYADLSVLQKMTQWTPVLSINDGIKKTINDLRYYSAS